LLFGHYLSDEQLLAWAYQALTGRPDGSEGGAWDDDDPAPTPGSRERKRKLLVPTVEDILRAWLRNRVAFEEIDTILNIHDAKTTNLDDTAMKRFRVSLGLIKSSLGLEQPR
jgi:hypothetical protein